MMIAQVTGFEPGEFVHVIADAHIYDRHIDLVKEVMEKKPFDAPKVRLNPDITDFYKFTVDDFIVEDYNFHKLGKKVPVAI